MTFPAALPAGLNREKYTMQQNMPGGGPALLLWFLIMIGIAAGYFVLLVAVWRAMRAHEAIAQAVKDIARNLERPPASRPDVDRFTLGD